jgi:hypothetical protein
LGIKDQISDNRNCNRFIWMYDTSIDIGSKNTGDISSGNRAKPVATIEYNPVNTPTPGTTAEYPVGG